jgi:dimeric dUTPase (all-alpha-NTP-PPase superfamily)
MKRVYKNKKMCPLIDCLFAVFATIQNEMSQKRSSSEFLRIFQEFLRIFRSLKNYSEFWNLISLKFSGIDISRVLE